jgi:hypothetical protein
VPPARLAREAGTALPSLAEQIGPVVHVLGTGLVVMLLGMSGLRTSTVVFNLVQERLPSRVRTTLTVPRRRADLLFEPRDASDRLRLGVRYLGLSQGVARLRVDVQRDGGFEHTEVLVDETWNADGLLAGVRTTPGGAATLTLDVLDAQPEAVRLRVTTAMRVSVQGDWDGAERPMGDLTELDAALREMLTWLIRRGEATLAVVARSRGEDEGAARATLDALVALGFAERVDDAVDPRYRIRLVRRGRPMSPEVWTALDPSAPPEPTARHGVAPSTRWLSVWRVLLSDAGQFVASSSPIVVVLLIGEALLLTGNASFAGVLGFTGVLANSMTAGIFPALLLLASRRKGDCVPGTVYRLLGAPAFVIGVSTLSAANLFVHGLVIYREMWSRACALILGAAIVAVTARMIRAGAFRRRSVVELREDLRAGGAVVLGVVSGGRPLATEITLGRPDGEEVRRADSVSVPTLSKLGYVIVRVPAGAAEELKVWAHRITPGGATEPLPALAEVRAGEDTRRFDLKLSGGQVVTRVGECEGWVRITLSGADDS